MNPLHPDLMTAEERRAQLCTLLALGLIRLHQRNFSEISSDSGDRSLHFQPNECRHATAKKRRDTWATPIPLLVEMEELAKEHRPGSSDPDLWEVWTGKRSRAIDWPSLVKDWTGLSQA